MVYSFSKYKAQYKANLVLALPVILSQLGQVIVQLADNAMVGQYGGDNHIPLSAVSFGGTVFFILFVACMGISFGITPLVGELFAQGRKEESAKYLHNGLILYTLLGFWTMALQLLVVPLMYKLGQPIEVVDMAIPYYETLAWSMVPVTIFFTFKQWLEGVGNTHTAMFVVIICNVLNIFLNWVFIYGKFGFDEMGALGAGVSTFISRVAMAAIMIIYFWNSKRYSPYLRSFKRTNISPKHIKELLSIGFPISTQMFFEASAFIISSIMMGWISSVAISANQIGTTMGNCAFMIVVAIGSATTIRISHCYGRRNFAELKLASSAALHLGLLWNLFTATAFITLRHWLPMMFTSNPEVIEMASTLLIFISIYQLSDGIQCIGIGVLRGIQDVKVIIPIAIISYWILNVPIGYYLCFTRDMGPVGLYIGFIFGLTCAAILAMLRISYKIKRLK